MKKTLLLILAAAMALCLCACNEQTQPEEEKTAENVLPANPITECASIEEMNNIAGTNLMSPGVMGVSDEAFRVIDCGDYKIAEYAFSVNGMPYTLRNASVADEDISGIYINGAPAFSGEFTDMATVATEELKAARWATIDGQFVLAVNDGGKMDKDTFEGIASEIKTTMTPSIVTPEELAAFAGEYQDSTSGRATLSAEAKDGALAICVSWANSASETVEWTMTATLAEDGLLSYGDCSKKTVTTNEKGEETVAVESTDGSGHFSPDGEKLLWNGAEEEQCRECVFEKMQ